MQDIRQVIRRKQAQQAQLSKEIELLLQAEEKFREIAPLLADSDDDDSAVLAEVDDDINASNHQAAKAASASSGSEASAPQTEAGRPLALRWP